LKARIVAQRIHHPLRYIDSAPSDVRMLIRISNGGDWPAVNSHAQPSRGVLVQRPSDLDRAASRGVWSGKKRRHHSVANRQTN